MKSCSTSPGPPWARPEAGPLLAALRQPSEAFQRLTLAVAHNGLGAETQEALVRACHAAELRLDLAHNRPLPWGALGTVLSTTLPACRSLWLRVQTTAAEPVGETGRWAAGDACPGLRELDLLLPGSDVGEHGLAALADLVLHEERMPWLRSLSLGAAGNDLVDLGGWLGPLGGGGHALPPLERLRLNLSQNPRLQPQALTALPRGRGPAPALSGDGAVRSRTAAGRGPPSWGAGDPDGGTARAGDGCGGRCPRGLGPAIGRAGTVGARPPTAQCRQKRAPCVRSGVPLRPLGETIPGQPTNGLRTRLVLGQRPSGFTRCPLRVYSLGLRPLAPPPRSAGRRTLRPL